MGEAFLAGLLDSEIADDKSITVAEPDPARRAYLEDRYPAKIVEQAAEAVSGAEVVLVSVKPDDVGACLDAARAGLASGALVISIAAGVRLSSLSAHLPEGQDVVRAMPNLGATVGAGVSAFAAPDSLDSERMQLAGLVLGAVGPAIRLDTEEQLDLVTAVSGSGPAYVFALAEAMEEAAVRGGLAADDAELLVSQTILGAGRLLTERGPRSLGGLTATEWREAVTSKGGTTAAALAEFNRSDLDEIVSRAIEAARDRSSQLGS